MADRDMPAPRREPADLAALLRERPEEVVAQPVERLRAQSRRDFLIFSLGAAAAAVGAAWLLPDRNRTRLFGRGAAAVDGLLGRVGLTRPLREQVLDRVLAFDDQVAAAMYSEHRLVRTYTRTQVTPLRNNYHGRTPGPEILPGWTLNVSGLASGRTERLTTADLLGRFRAHEQVTRLICVEGWSAVSWWGGIRFADLLRAFPPAAGARWAALTSNVSLDARGRPEPYYVSLDLGTARHPQTLLVTHHLGQPLTLAHGAPLRLIAPVKLGLKNIKALTDITYMTGEPPDYWNERGYSRYDGI